MPRDTRRTRMVLGLLLIVAFSLITIDVRGGTRSPVDALRDIGATVFGPVERAASSIVDPVSDAVSAVTNLGQHRATIARLRDENAELRRQLHTSSLARHEARQLEELLGLAGAGRYKIMPAKVIALGSAQGFRWTVTIDVGRRDGIETNMTVINGDGLVGRVTRADSSVSTVLLAIDPVSSAGARVAESMEIGIVSGRGNQDLELQLLDGQAALRPGDRLVTFGSRGNHPYAPGLPIGEVTSVEKTPGAPTRSAEVRAYADFTALDVLGVVIKSPRDDPRDALLPRPPETPEPSASASPVPPVTPSPGAATPPLETAATRPPTSAPPVAGD
ncbi:MAG: rod shape-determining protein MreC [Carbonactinosporaceae bacterium]